MAQRRMFSKSITNSSSFLMMPQSSQSLYFHLGMNADDDGFCEIFSLMRMTESKPDDLKILQAKGYVTVFDDRVLIITNWNENNLIRSDRYTPSKYLAIYRKELMMLAKNNTPETMENSGVQMVNQMDTAGIPAGVHEVNPGFTQVRLGKDSIGKDTVTSKKLEFMVFWTLYPKKVERKRSEMKWNNLSLETQQTIVADLEKRVMGEKWLKDMGKYIEMPTTYLNGERWNDEITLPKIEVPKTYSI